MVDGRCACDRKAGLALRRRWTVMNCDLSYWAGLPTLMFCSRRNQYEVPFLPGPRAAPYLMVSDGEWWPPPCLCPRPHYLKLKTMVVNPRSRHQQRPQFLTALSANWPFIFWPCIGGVFLFQSRMGQEMSSLTQKGQHEGVRRGIVTSTVNMKRPFSMPLEGEK